MMILALEFSSAQRSVAVVCGRAGEPASSISEVVETGANGTMAFAMIQSVLQEAKLERDQIETLVIGLGPGSYTGIRVALAIAQGWQLAAGPGRIKLLGVSSADCLAAQAQAETIRGRVSAVIDAQRDEFYLATYEMSVNGWTEIEPLRILTRTEVAARAGTNEMWIGPEVTRWFPDGRTVFPRAATLGQLALNRNVLVAGEKLEPIYLRETNFVKAPPSRWPAL